jgi:cobalt-zinc-cadmium efflux system protein
MSLGDGPLCFTLRFAHADMHVHSHASHAHAHGHAHGSRASTMPGARRRLTWALLLAASYMAAEAIGGYITGSLALLADAGHMLSDVGALGLALFAMWLAQRPPTSTRTYGFHRAEILAALANGSILVGISLVIFWEAFARLRNPQPVEGPLMMGLAAGGLLINLVSLALLSGGREHSLNVRAAWLHVMSDTLGSVQTLVAGFLIWKFSWNWADPLASILIGVLLIISSWNVLKEAVGVLMEGTPSHLDVDRVREALLATPGVEGVHDLHLWTLTSGREALSGHVVITAETDAVAMLSSLRASLHDRFGIDHLTLQLEPKGFEEQGCCS